MLALFIDIVYYFIVDMAFSGQNFQVCSLSTIMREFTAMHSVACLPFKDLILSAAEKHKDVDDQSRAWNVPQPLMDHLKANLNDSQLEAVNVSILFVYFGLVDMSIVSDRLLYSLGRSFTQILCSYSGLLFVHYYH
jgi:hypothetical protein